MSDASVSAAVARRVVRGTTIVAFVGGLGGGLVFPILPALGLQLGISGFMVGLILAANRLTRILVNVPAGRLVDALGGRRPLALGMLLEAVGVMAFSAALHLGHPQWWLLAGRIVWGFGSALLIVGVQATVLAVSGHADRGRRAASVRVALSLGMPGGLVLGGVISDLVSDDAAFWTCAVLALAGAVIALWQLPPMRFSGQRSRQGQHKGSWVSRLRRLVNLPEFPILATAWGFNALTFLCVQGVLLATLVLLVHQRDLQFWGLGAQGTAGLVMALMISCSAAVTFMLGRGIDRLQLRSIIMLPSLVVLAIGFALLGRAHSIPMLLLGVVFIGIAFNGVILPMLALLGDVTPHDQYGQAVGVYQVFGDVGGSLGPMIGLAVGMHLGLTPLYLALTVLIALSGIVAVWLYRVERRELGAIS